MRLGRGLAPLLGFLTAAGCGKGVGLGEVAVAVPEPASDAPLGARITLGLAPDSSIDFGEVRVHAARAQSFVVENLGQATSSALEIAVTGVGFTLGARAVRGGCVNGETVLAGGGRCSVTVTFGPSAEGPATASLTVAADMGGAPPALELSGSGYSRGLFHEYPVFPVGVDSQPMGITTGPDGKLWFTQTGVEFFGVGNATTAGVVSMVPTRLSLLTGGWARPTFGIVPWSDGDLWLKRQGSFVLDAVTPAGTSGGSNLVMVASADAPSAELSPEAMTGLTGVAIAADGGLWFAELDTDTVACFRFTNQRSLKPCPHSPIPIASGSHPFGITRGPDGAMWFTERTGNRIVRITSTGEVIPFDIPTAGSGPTGIAAGPDGNVWFTEEAANQIGRITPPDGPFAEFVVPTGDSGPFWIAPGPDGAMWFTERGADQIGRITPSGAIEEYATPTKPSGPAGIVTGPDGNLWFTESTANQIGQVTP